MKNIIRKIISVLVTPEMVFFILKELSKKSDNNIDDSTVMLVKAAYYNEPANVRKAVIQLLHKIDD